MKNNGHYAATIYLVNGQAKIACPGIFDERSSKELMEALQCAAQLGFSVLVEGECFED